MHHLTLCQTEAIDTLAHPEVYDHVELASSALSIFTDFHEMLLIFTLISSIYTKCH